MNNNDNDKNIKILKQTLDKKIIESSSVTIVPHIRADFDALGSAYALYILALRHKKDVNILINDTYKTLDLGAQYIINEMLIKGLKIINYDTYLNKFQDTNNLLILTDTSQQELIPIEKEQIDKKINEEKIIVIDHHPFGNSTIQAKDNFIFSVYSSTCEIITKMLFNSRVRFSKDLATYLYAGIWLDSNRLTRKGTSNETHKWAAKLVENNADIDKVNDLFAEEYDSNIQDLISNKMNILSYTIAYLIGDDDKYYTVEELAKVADLCLKYRIDGAFVIGNIEKNMVSVSARSKGKINVGEIMKELNGGGNVSSAAAKIKDETPYEVEKKLIKILRPNFYIDKDN